MFPERLIQSYIDFFEYFFGDTIARNAYGATFFYLGILLMFLLVCSKVIWNFNQTWKKAVTILFILIIPVGCNIINFIAVHADMYLLTIGGMSLIIPLCLVFLYKSLYTCYIMKRITGILFLAIMYSFILQDNADSKVLLETFKQTSSLTNRMWQEVENTSDYIPNMKVMIAGNPNMNNNLQLASDYITKVNWYARIGSFWSSWSGSTNCWQMFIKNEIGININSCTQDEYRAIANMQEFSNMPTYPTKGYIQIIDDIIVIKISNIDTIVYE